MMILNLLMNTQMICKMFIKILKKYNLGKKHKILIVFDDMIADMISNKKHRGIKLNISIEITQSYLKVPKDV